jgi:hypothetical protein
MNPYGFNNLFFGNKSFTEERKEKMKKLIIRKIKKYGEKLSKVSLIEYKLSNDKT